MLHTALIMQASAWRRRGAECDEPEPAATWRPLTRKKGKGVKAHDDGADWHTYIGRLFADR